MIFPKQFYYYSLFNFFMHLISKEINLANRKISFAAFLWFALALIALTIQVIKGNSGIQNYLIFRGVFWHTIAETDLYIRYEPHLDLNHYGPAFSLIVAPFALLPRIAGSFLWGLANAAILFYAVRKLPISYRHQNFILFIGVLEMMTSTHNVQYNPMVTSWIMFTYILIHNKKDYWATLFIAIGFLTKLYGIAALAFFIFSENKFQFIISFVFWMGVLFFLPMLLSSPSFIIESYKDWYLSVSRKNNANQDAVMQGMSVMRIIKKIFLIENLKDIYILVTAGLCYFLSALRFSQFKETNFQLSYLAFLLIGVVIFSSSAESPTFIIAMIGVGIWYIAQDEKRAWITALLIFAIIFTSLSTTDLFPKSIKSEYIRPYAVKALPCFLIWLVLFYQLLTKDFRKNECVLAQT